MNIHELNNQLTGPTISRRLFLRGTAGALILSVSGGLLVACRSDDGPPAPIVEDEPQEPESPDEDEHDETSGELNDPDDEITPESDEERVTEETTEDTEEEDDDVSSQDVGEETPDEDRPLRYGLSGPIANLDPYTGTSLAARTIKLQLYSRLIQPDADGEFSPDLAIEWSFAEDGMECYFTLRDDVTFHSGELFGAADVLATFEHILNEDSNAILRLELGAFIDSIESEDNRQVNFSFVRPHPAFFDYLALPEASILSASSLNEGHDFEVVGNGTGPFILTGDFNDSVFRMERFEEYYVTDEPALDLIEFHVIENAEERLEQFYDGEFDLAEAAPMSAMTTLDARDDINLQVSKYFAFSCLVYNTSVPPFDNPAVRRALNFALDRQAIVDAVYFGQGETITGGLIPPISWAHNPELEDSFVFDPDRARELLIAAGLQPDAEVIEVSLLVNEESQQHQAIAEIVQHNLGTVGITCTIEAVDWSTLSQRHNESDYQFRVHDLSTDIVDPSYLRSFFHSTSSIGGMSSNFADADIDELLEQAGELIDRDERRELYWEVEERLLNLSPWALLCWRVQGDAVHTWVEGYERINGAFGSLSSLSLRRVKLGEVPVISE